MPYLSVARQLGLVSLLELQSQGEVPSILADQIASVIDVQEFVLAGKRERLLSAGVAIAGGIAGQFAFADLTIPQNESWLIYAYSISGVVPIGTQIQVAPTVQVFQSNGTRQPYLTAEPVLSAFSVSASLVIAGGFLPKPFIVPPNSIMGGVTLSLSAAGAVTGFGTVDFVRLRN